jgi:hypothetical protein
MATCKTCNHPDVEAINNRLAAGDSIRATAEAFGLDRTSLGRHAKAHALTVPAVGDAPAGRHYAAAAALVDEVRRRLGDDYSAQELAEAENLLAVATLADANPASLAAARELRLTLGDFRQILEARPTESDPDELALIAAMSAPHVWTARSTDRR